MLIVFRIVDRHGKQVHLTKERWSHIVSRHPELVNKLESIQEIIANPDFEVKSKTNQQRHYFHRFVKEIKMYLVVAVKYLNGSGFIITAFHNKNKKQ